MQIDHPETFIIIPANLYAVVHVLDNFSDDWQEALKFLVRLADIQGVYLTPSPLKP